MQTQNASATDFLPVLDPMLDSAITSSEAAELVGITDNALALMRMRGRGPIYVRLSDTPRGRVRYTRRDVLDWLRENRRDPCSERGK